MRSTWPRSFPTFPRPDCGLAMMTIGPNGLVTAGSGGWSRQQAPRVHDPLRVERGLDPRQNVHPGPAQLRGEKPGLQPPHTVMVGECPAHGSTAFRCLVPCRKITRLRVMIVGPSDQEREVQRRA